MKFYFFTLFTIAFCYSFFKHIKGFDLFLFIIDTVGIFLTSLVICYIIIFLISVFSKKLTNNIERKKNDNKC